MRSKTIFGALLVSVALCSQGFGFELLDRMLGLNSGGCGECKACAKVACCDPCTKVAACDPCAKACCPEPACCEKACPQLACCEQATCGKCKKCRPTPVRDLFGNLKDLFEAKGCYCEPVCQPACDPACGNTCEPACEQSCKTKRCRKQRCAKACDPCGPATCEPACEPTCVQPKCHKLYRRPLVELLENLFGGRNCGCGMATCGDSCGVGCGGAAPAPAMKTPAKAPEKAAPLPKAPKADPSASIPTRGIYQAQSLVRN